VGVYLALRDDRYPSTDEHQSVHLDYPYPDAARDLNRWLPLVKWLLAIPHYVVLFFLFIAVVVVVIVAWFAILFTGRYPRGMFHFVEGVIRGAAHTASSCVRATKIGVETTGALALAGAVPHARTSIVLFLAQHSTRGMVARSAHCGRCGRPVSRPSIVRGNRRIGVTGRNTLHRPEPADTPARLAPPGERS
jgi:hypothetical protein